MRDRDDEDDDATCHAALITEFQSLVTLDQPNDAFASQNRQPHQTHQRRHRRPPDLRMTSPPQSYFPDARREARQRIEPKSNPQVVFMVWPIPSEDFVDAQHDQGDFHSLSHYFGGQRIRARKCWHWKHVHRHWTADRSGRPGDPRWRLDPTARGGKEQ
jgi:hypothetical protein